MTATECASGVGTGHASELLAALEDVATLLASLPALDPTSGGRDAWAQVIGTTQRAINSATAVQDEAIVALAAIEPVLLEDGTEAETHRAPGHVALDAAAIVSGALEVTANHAEDRVRDAVRRAADGNPGTSTCTGLGGLHDAMRAGVLDRYRAGVVEHELELAPPEVAEAVIESLGEHLAYETGTQLRRRTRRLLARISPDLLRQRAQRAREECGLRRRVGEPGVDQWEGSFPSEDAARAWAAIDARARELIADGTFDRIERARSQALIDLVMQSATVTTVITLTVPADRSTTAPAGQPTAAPTVPDTATIERASAVAPSAHVAATTETTPAVAPSAEVAPSVERTAAVAASEEAATAEETATAAPDPATIEKTSAAAASDEPAATEKTPGVAASAEVAASVAGQGLPADGLPVTVDEAVAAAAAAVEQRQAGEADGGFVEVATGRGTEQVLVPTAWLTDQLAAANAATTNAMTTNATTTNALNICGKKRSGRGKAHDRGKSPGRDEVRVETRTCDPVTGALLSDAESGAYRPPERIAALVRQRDGRCRFPGCHVAARYTDLDHVRPWPTGPTTAANLICLCRRHHRIKQRPGWRVTLHPDGTVEWTDPTGRQRTTLPVDALHTLTIPGTPTTEAAPATPTTEAAPATPATPATPTTATAATAATADTVTTRTDAEWAPFSHLEFALEHLLGPAAHDPAPRRPQVTSSGVRVHVIRPLDTITVVDPHRPCRRPRPGRRVFPDEPPF